ncbi:MAG: MBL fold metallo-hydrolase [Propionibacteriaceae bacterium]|jgi:glyoxylase-like metal-dependent hydrolase (beta-lactamase superfamily II)|nr:MBL fold metallo-hydrolase [Propionibacteriaceae bacterium]
MDFSEVRTGIFTSVLDEADAVVTVVVGESGCLLVDTGSSPTVGAAIRAGVLTLTDKPLQAVVLTHAHWDHALGLAAYTDVETIGHENLATDIGCTENVTWARRHGVDLTHVALPTTRLGLIAARDLGGVTAEIASYGPAHTRSDLIIAVPGRGVIIVGDLVESGPPQFDETSSLDGWVRTLDSLYSLLKDTTVVIPGHGAPLGPGEIAHFRTGLAGIWDQAEWAFYRGIPERELYEYDNLEWPWDRPTAEAGIAAAYRELATRPVPVAAPTF